MRGTDSRRIPISDCAHRRRLPPGIEISVISPDPMHSSLRVVHVYKSYPPVRGGIEGHIDLLTRLLVERGIGAEVLCARVPGSAAQEDRHGVRVHRCTPALTLASTPLPPTLPLALRRSEAHLV